MKESEQRVKNIFLFTDWKKHGGITPQTKTGSHP